MLSANAAPTPMSIGQPGSGTELAKAGISVALNWMLSMRLLPVLEVAPSKVTRT